MNWITIIQGLSSKKLMITMFVIYMLSELAAKTPDKADICIYIMAGLTGVFLGCQTVLDWRSGIDKRDSGADSGDTVTGINTK